jgi:hypothetical protein
MWKRFDCCAEFFTWNGAYLGWCIFERHVCDKFCMNMISTLQRNEREARSKTPHPPTPMFDGIMCNVIGRTGNAGIKRRTWPGMHVPLGSNSRVVDDVMK